MSVLPTLLRCEDWVQIIDQDIMEEIPALRGTKT